MLVQQNIAQFRVAGLKFHRFAECQSEIREGGKLFLQPDPKNEFDPHAVAVYHKTNAGELIQIGFVEKSVAATLSDMMQALEGAIWYAKIIIYDPTMISYNTIVANAIGVAEWPIQSEYELYRDRKDIEKL